MAEEQYSHARLTTAAAGTPPVQQAGHTNETYHGGVRGPFSDPKQTHTGRQSTDRRFDQSVQSITQSPNRPIAQSPKSNPAVRVAVTVVDTFKRTSVRALQG